MSFDLLKRLSQKFPVVYRADIEDAVQDANLDALQHPSAVKPGFGYVASRNNIITASEYARAFGGNLVQLKRIIAGGDVMCAAELPAPP